MGTNRLSLAAFFAVALLFILVQAKGLVHIAPGDENVYYYMAKSVSEGELPYRDFFYAHPPLHILILSVIIKVFGMNFAVLKSATLMSLLTASFFLYKTSLELFKNRLNERYASLISALALVLFLFSFEVMFKATFSMGINFSLMFLMISVYLIFTKRYSAGGIFAALAGLTRFYALIPVFAIFIFIILKHIPKKSRETGFNDIFYMLAGFFITFGTAIAALLMLFGQDFYEPVFKYHLLKQALPNQKITVYKHVLMENWALFAAFLLSFFIKNKIFTKNKKEFQLFYFILFAYLLFLLSLNVIAEFYFIIAFPFIAIIGAYAVIHMINSMKLRYIKYALIFLISLAYLWNTAADAAFLEKIGFLEFSQLNNLADKISSTDQNQKIFGDDSIVTLLALMSNRSIALNYIDANEKRLTSGLTNFYLLANKLDDANLSYIILRENMGMHQILEFRQYVEDRCLLEKKYFDIAEGSFLVYRCFK